MDKVPLTTDARKAYVEYGVRATKEAATRKAWNVYFYLLSSLDRPGIPDGKNVLGDGTLAELHSLFVEAWISGDSSVHQAVRDEVGESYMSYGRLDIYRSLAATWIIPSQYQGVGGFGDGVRPLMLIPASTRFMLVLERHHPSEPLKAPLLKLLESLRRVDTTEGSDVNLEDYANEWGLGLFWDGEGQIGDSLALAYAIKAGRERLDEPMTSVIARKFSIRFLESYLLGDRFDPTSTGRGGAELESVQKSLTDGDWDRASKRLSKELIVKLRNDDKERDRFLSQSAEIGRFLRSEQVNTISYNLTWTDCVVTFSAGQIYSLNQVVLTYRWEDHCWKLVKLDGGMEKRE